ncbi:MAG: hypothetical protein WBP29_07140 [Candidatus Zixiibacteriota bacterium]
MKNRPLLTPAGGALIAVCFFLPWIKISCLGTSTYSGAQFGGVYWILFTAGLLICVAYSILRQFKRPELMAKVVAVASFISSVVIVYGVLTVAGGKRILLVRVGPDDVNLRLQIGAYGTLLGFTLAWIGVSPALRRRKPKPALPAPSMTEPKSLEPAELDHTSA